MKRVLITGGAGFIGSHCVDFFLSEGCEVGVFDIKSKKDAVNLSHAMNAITYIEGDIRELSQLDAVMGQYTHVLHLAADVSVPYSIEHPIETHETNVTGTLNVLHSAATHTIQRVVYASSAAVYGDTNIVSTHEEAPLMPLSPYGLHKVINEQYAQLFSTQYGLSSVGLRFFNVYGSRQDPHSPYSGVISIFHHKMKQGQSPVIFGDGNATRDFIHVSDVARFCLNALGLEKKGTPVYNIGTGTAVSITELFDTLQEVLGQEIEAIYECQREGDILHSCAEIARIQNDFKCTPSVRLLEGLKELCKYT